MSADQAAEPARTYTKVERADKSIAYECNLFGDESPDLDAARAHRAVHVAGPDLLAALTISRGQWIHSVNSKQCLAAIAKAEPKG